MKTIDKALKELFVKTASGASFTLPPGFPAFDGHFPGQPVLPAVVQVKMAVYTLSEHFSRKFKLKEIKKAKFAAPVQAGDSIEIIFTAKENSFDIIIKNESKAFSSFQITVE